MVEAIVSFAVERLGDMLIQEAVSLYGVHEQVEQLRNELRRMLCFLKDADRKQQQGDELVHNWVSEIRDVAYDAEDIIDTFILNVESKRSREGIKGFLMRTACIFNKWKHLYKVRMEIQPILIKLEHISRSQITYGIRSLNDEETPSSIANKKLQQQLRRSYPHVEDEDVIGLEEHTRELVVELVKEEERRRVISIIGVGGLGKTTLAKNVYKHHVIKNHFDCCAWTFISQQCSKEDVLREILKKINSLSGNEMSEEDLVEKLYKCLQKKRYLVVLDNIWSSEAWDILSPAFPNGKIGSKILLTTRNKEVALRADPWSFHLEPRFLTDEESWELLRKKAFPKNNMADTSFSPGLEKIGREMVRKCGGLPLGVTVLGGLLATKKSDIIEWEVVYKNINMYMNRGQNGVMGILSLSYNDLPYHLKPCFLYLGLFPEDFEIPVKELIKLWIAEGFIPQQNGETMEDLGELQYLAELIQRCMVQVSERSITGRIQTCQLHDLMRDLCLLKAREDNFLDIYHEELATDSSITTSPTTTGYRLRRYAMHKGQQRYSALKNSTPHLRTLVFIPYAKNLNIFENIELHHHNIKLLRVLDLGGVYDDTRGNITKEIGKLIHLRYLRLTNIRMGRISPSIRNLRSLQTLDLSGYFGIAPKVIKKLGHLRHLHLPNYCYSKNLEIGNLIHLQTLKWVCAGKWMIEGGLKKMSNLRKLGICGLLGSELEKILDSIVVISSDHNPLTSLYLELNYREFLPNMEPLSRCHNLLKLNLRGSCQVKYHFQFPPNITKLTLTSTCFSQDPFADLQHLLNLKYLYLDTAYNGEEMVCHAEGFPQLKSLHLVHLRNLEKWRVDQGGMPSLNHLEIFGCQELRMLPEGLRFVTTIQKLEINSMPLVFRDRVVKGGEDWNKVQHIPSITFRKKLYIY